ncbi:hypothetical protein [Marinobacter sp. CA1]|uniref:hypothetical protein n=1 Tax=Marinobacter sp. CA1 TaxID=2817656 RepID=UPI001D08A355|nr:hypothetical protein [Marinobacter sp. CA1]UDL04020.1 hypothetical protein J2887_15030 [Marinobacter sp. CA1]
MNTRRFKLKNNTSVRCCPQCGNNQVFTAHSDYCAEDCCEVWVVCKCGYDPTSEKSGFRLEDVWGGVDDANIMDALSCWNDALSAEEKQLTEEREGA